MNTPNINLDDYELVKIVSVTRGDPTHVFDIEIDSPDHAFVAKHPSGAVAISHNSALISLSNLTDEKMRDAKIGQWWVENPQRALSNNSVVYKEKPEIGTFMEEWISLYKSKSGERGIFNREAAKTTIEKLGDRRDPNQEWGVNPCCIPGDVFVETNKGQIPISQVIDDPDGFLILTHNHETDKKEYTEIIDGRMTRPNASLVELEITDENGKIVSLKLTPDHRVWTENRGYVEAQHLNENDEVVISENYTYRAGIDTTENLYETQNNNSNIKMVQ